ncbi:MAG: hypothetical protein J6M18_06495 [Actinomycetaceae bacterium]|nr:hypothetical protein [Actinomycetaceae bacterium]
MYSSAHQEKLAVSNHQMEEIETQKILLEWEKGFEKYGNQGLYNNIQTCNSHDLANNIQRTSWNSFANCIANKIANIFGMDILKRAFNQQVRTALKSRQWKVASSIIHKNITKIVGKKAASFLVIQIAKKALPGGLPGQIAFAAGKCAIKEIW